VNGRVATMKYLYQLRYIFCCNFLKDMINGVKAWGTKDKFPLLNESGLTKANIHVKSRTAINGYW